MRYTTISVSHGTHHTVAAFWIVGAFWIVAGIVAAVGLGGGLTRSAVALAIVTTEWWLISEVERIVWRETTPEARRRLPAMTHLRPALTGQRDLKKTSAHASWRGPRAA